MTKRRLNFEAVIPNTGTPISFAGGEGGVGFLKLQHDMTAEQIEQLLNLRGSVLRITIQKLELLVVPRSEDQVESYAGSTKLRPLILGVASFIPFLGTVATTADQLILEHLENERKERLQFLLDELDAGQEDFGGPIPIERSDPLIHAAYITIEATVRTHRREKIRAFARLLLSGLGDNPKISIENEHEDFLKILDDLSLREMILLKVLNEFEVSDAKKEEENNIQRTVQYWPSFIERACQTLNVPADELEGILSRLTRTGTYEPFTGSFYGYEGGMGKLTALYRRLEDALKSDSQGFDSGAKV